MRIPCNYKMMTLEDQVDKPLSNLCRIGTSFNLFKTKNGKIDVCSSDLSYNNVSWKNAEDSNVFHFSQCVARF